MAQIKSILIPGSKSISNRALILASLSEKKTILKNISTSSDTIYLIKALKKLKLKTEQKNETIKLYTGNAGTTTRFLIAVSILLNKKITIDASPRMRNRPISQLLKALGKLGAKITSNKAFLPITIHPSNIRGAKISLPGNISSQFLSALLLICPFIKGETTITIEQELYSKPYIEMTLKILKMFGIKIKNKKFRQFIIKGNQKIKSPTTYTIESDASSASYLGAYCTLHPDKNIFLKNINNSSIQGDIKFLDYLKKIGCIVQSQKKGVVIKSPKDTQKLRSLKTIDMNETPDLVMTFVVIAMFTKGKTKFTNIANLRIKESNRIQALKNEIKKFNIKIKTRKDFIEIEGNPKLLKNPIQNLTINTYDDHRIAMAFGILKDIFPNLKIENPNCVSKSYTSFWKDLNLISEIEHKNIILIGLRGSGKTKIGRLLAKKLHLKPVDTDREIESAEKNTIAKIVQKHDWNYFRKIEQKILKKIAKKTKKDFVLSTGGGIVLDKENRIILKNLGKIIYLKRSPKDCEKFIELKRKTRPPLTDSKDPLEEMQKLYKERDPIYKKLADIIIKRTSDLEKDTKEILAKI